MKGTERARAEHVPAAKAQRARPIREDHLIEAGDHVSEVFPCDVVLEQLMVVLE